MHQRLLAIQHLSHLLLSDRMNHALRTITTITAVGSGLAGGVFFAFSSFVMPALRRLPSGQGIAAMQSINKQAPTPAFMTLLFGTAALSAGLGVYAVLHRDEPQAAWLLGGSVSYLASIVITGAFHATTRWWHSTRTRPSRLAIRPRICRSGPPEITSVL